MRLDEQELEALLVDIESYRVERKESARGDGPKKIREAVCAFANDLPGTGEPGIVFVGATDAGTPTDEPITDALLLQLSDMKTDGNIVPPPTMLVEKRRVSGSEIAVVTVLPSDSPPVRYRGQIHIRIGPRRGIATAQDEKNPK
jgi:ATP-dependent DNA helicase RecG